LLSLNYASGLAILLALLALAALAARILLLLAGLLAAALLLAGLLTRVLILLARILVLIGHSGSPILRCWGMQRGDNGEGPALVSEKTSVPARSLRGRDLLQLWRWNRPKTTRVQPLKPHPALFPPPVPTVGAWTIR
jgi:hypothetical protein